MKTPNKNRQTITLPTSAKELTWHTTDHVFKKTAQSKAFKKSYEEEAARILLAKKIRQTRLEKRLTQQAVAKRAVMPQSAIARLESGEHSISVDTLLRVAHALGKEVELI
ncbi:MAG: helix-turn-helix transcriptional regulator [bacterium]|nr:helix-turn-helix transcriptional regulator [bacterium]